MGVLIVAALAAGGYALVHNRPGQDTAQSGGTGTSGQTGAGGHTGTPTGSPSPASPVVASPSGTVNAYFTALNNHQFGRAWRLGGRNTGSTYTAYVNGYDTTQQSTVQILSVSGSVVSARVTALQTDSTVKTFQGTYTVTDGVITAFNVHQVS
jgi:hypothetical protein